MVENLAMFWISTIPTFTISQLCCLVSPHPLLLPFSGIRLYRYQSGLNIVCKICQTHCQKVPKRRWHQARNKQQGIRGNHLGTVTLSYRISGDTYYDRQKCVCVWGGGGGGGGRGVDREQKHATSRFDSQSNCTSSHSWSAKHVRPAKCRMKPETGVTAPNTADQHWLKSNLS